MIYLRDEFPDHPKAVAAGLDGIGLYVVLLGYCNRFLTGGFIPGDHPRMLARGGAALMRRLCEVRLCHAAGHDCDHGCPQPAPGNFVIHDYVEENRSAEAKRSEKARKAANDRWEKERQKAAANGNGEHARADAQASSEQMLEQMPEHPPSTPPVRERARGPQPPTPTETSLVVTSPLPTGAGIGEGNPLANARRAAGEILDEAHRRSGSAPLTPGDRKRLRPLIVDDWLPAGHPPERIAQAIADANARTDKGVGFMLNQLARPGATSGGRTPADPMAGLRAAAAKGRP